MRKIKALLFIAAVAAAVYLSWPSIDARFFTLPRIHSKIDSLDYLYEPVQIETTGSAVVRIDRTDVRLEYVAEYEIAGRVVGIEDYSGRKVEDKLSPRDVAIAWGWLSDDNVDSEINWGPYGYRSFKFTVPGALWHSSVGGTDAILSSMSNNHLIPHSNETRRKISDIRIGDFIKIEGYLVNATYDIGRNGRYFVWNTDTARNNSDCEIIYVTSVVWLQGPY